MQKNKSTIDIIKTIADEMGFTTKYLTKDKRLGRLLIQNDEKICIVNSSVFGWYPEMKRWQFQLFNSKILTQKLLKVCKYKTISSRLMEYKKYSSLTQMHWSVSDKVQKFPVIVKPDVGFKGNDISVVATKTSLRKVLQKHYIDKKDVLIQPILKHNEYRILIVNNKVELVHIKQHHHITGDGKTTIETLLAPINARRKDETFIAQQLQLRTLKRTSVLPKGEKFPYHLTRYSDPNDYYESTNIPKEVSKWAQKLAKDISCSTIGIDIFAPKGLLQTDAYIVIELNANPALEYIQSRYNDPHTMKRIIQNTLSHYFSV